MTIFSSCAIYHILTHVSAHARLLAFHFELSQPANYIRLMWCELAITMSNESMTSWFSYNSLISHTYQHMLVLKCLTSYQIALSKNYVLSENDKLKSLRQFMKCEFMRYLKNTWLTRLNAEHNLFKHLN